ncbi:DUF2637 domain-containing protein [Nocardia sp. NPDC057353]|uniref:DUF2637 domain-containing protein n=1 Tax=Nocardia sp. NPDC057353 TaxID=3346104 RepID=UPI0036325E9D
MRAARWVAVLVIVTIGVAAFALSFAALEELAIMARTPEDLAWLWPVIVDGTIIQATISMLVLASGPERRWFLGVLVCGALVSVVGNSVHAAMAGEHLPWWAAALVAAVAPVSLLVDTHGLAMLFRASQRTTADPVPEVPAPAAVVVESRPADPGPSAKPVPVRRRKPAARRDPARVAKAIELHSDGKSFPEIAAALGVSTSTARNYVGTAKPADTPAPAPVPVSEPAPVQLAPVAAPPARPAVPPRAVTQPMLPLAVAARG